MKLFFKSLFPLALIVGMCVQINGVQGKNIEETAQTSAVNMFRETFESAIPTFSVTLDVQNDNSRTSRLFVVGETCKFVVRSEQDGYLYLFNQYVDENGNVQIKLIFPKRNEDNFIAAGAEVVFPRPQDKFKFEAKKANGRELLMALVVDRKYPAFEEMTFTNEKEIRKASATLEKCFDVVYDNNEQITDEFVEYDPPKDEPLGFGRRILRVETFATERERDNVKRKMIFVGIGVDKFKFNGQGINNFFVPTCYWDVVDLKNLLIEQGVVEENNCYVLLNEEATQENVRRLFQKTLPEAAASGASIISLVTTHGNTVASVEKKRARSRELYLVLYDTNPKDLYHTGISSNEFGDWAQGLQNSRICFLFDNCYSGLMIDERYDWNKLVSPITAAKSLGQPNISIIASSSPDQASGLESSQNLLYRSHPHSLMMNNILKSLEAQPSLSDRELFDLVKPIVAERYKEIYGISKSPAQFVNYASSFHDNEPFTINPESSSGSEQDEER